MKVGFTINAQSLRIVLIIAILLLFCGTLAGFTLAKNKLQEFATTISQLNADAKAKDDSIATLQELNKTIDTYDDVREKASAIAINASDYPVAVIQNVTKLASESGVTLTNVSYGDAAASSTTTPAPTPGGATESQPATDTSTTPSGVTKKTISVSVQSPLSYGSFMKFLEKIETDKMYLHVTKVSMTKGIDGSSVTTQPFTIEVYLR